MLPLNLCTEKINKIHCSGSFRDAVSQPSRIVVFAVGGLIKITDRVVISHHVTIAGQTAPGGGITIYGNVGQDWAETSLFRMLSDLLGSLLFECSPYYHSLYPLPYG